jgi:tetratricopeptide (TPR) repeat protein
VEHLLPSSSFFFATLASLHEKTGEPSEVVQPFVNVLINQALESYSQALDLDPCPEYYYKKGKVHQRLNQHDEAITMYAKVLEREEESEIRRKAALKKVIVEVRKLEESSHLGREATN